MPATPSTAANAMPGTGPRRPWATGRFRVRAMRASIRASAMWLTAAADPATRAMPSRPQITAPAAAGPGASVMPTAAQSSISRTTRGLVISR